MTTENISTSNVDKEKLIEGKPRKNIILVILGIVFLFAVVMTYINNSTKKEEASVNKEETDEKKITEASKKTISIEELTGKIERNKPKEEVESETIAKLKYDLEKEKSNKAKLDTSVTQSKVNNSNLNNANIVDEKTAHEELVATSPIYLPSRGSGLKNELTDNMQDVLNKLYQDQGKRIDDANIQAPAGENGATNSLNSQLTTHQDRNTSWLTDQSSTDYTHAPVKVNPAKNADNTIYEGTIIPVAVSQITSSDFPGKFKTVTTRPIYSKSGKILLAKGSTVLGIANTNVRPGQERVQAAFYRIITPKKDSIYLSGMQGVDEQGVIGVNGDVNNHYFKIFASSFGVALIQSLLTKNDNSVNVNNPSGDVTIETGAVKTIGDVATAQLERNKTIAPTITLKAGQEFNITVTKDILIENI